MLNIVERYLTSRRVRLLIGDLTLSLSIQLLSLLFYLFLIVNFLLCHWIPFKCLHNPETRSCFWKPLIVLQLLTHNLMELNI